MTLHIKDEPGVVTVTQHNELGRERMHLSHDEQRELLEALARVHGFSLVDHVERRQLVELVEEVRHPEQTPEPNIHLVRSKCSWRQEAEALAEALAEAVADALELLPHMPPFSKEV